MKSSDILKKYRRSGIRQMLLDETGKWFIKNKIDRVKLKASVKNEVAISFWKKQEQGFNEYIYFMYKDLKSK